MALFSLEHSRAAYSADFVMYGGAVALLSTFLVWDGPRVLWPEMAALALAGMLGWTLIEYALHRFVLHGLQPFKGWHMAHHLRPTALICAPTVLSAVLIFVLVFLPALLLGSLLRACALTLGVLTGYLGYAITHHATHHWRGEGVWLKQRKHWHALHHHAAEQPAYFGVTSKLWDRVFGTAA